MLSSMTGHGVGQATVAGRTLRVELRSVNHRYLDIRMRAPVELADQGSTAEAMVRARMLRGRIDVSIRLEGDTDGDAATPRIDKRKARAVFAALRELRDELAPEAPLPLSVLGMVPGLFEDGTETDLDALRRAIEAATRQACDGLWQMRRQEGQALQDELERLRLAACHEVQALQAGVTPMVQAYRRKLQERITALLDDRGVPLDPGRLEHEIALFADRADITEELTRLESHLTQLAQTANAWQSGGGVGRPEADGPTVSVGRKLDFLLQEMGREANTIGSKIADAELTLHVVELKAVIERMREQVQNVL